MKQYLLAVYMDPSVEPPAEDEIPQIYADVDQFNQRMMGEDKWVFGGGLELPDTATTVRNHTGGAATMTDGPYSEAKEQIGGFWVLRAADLDEALALAEDASKACRGAVEVRPFQDEPEDESNG